MSTASNGVKLIYGAAGLSASIVGDRSGSDFHVFVKDILTALKKERIGTLDTAEIYPGSEEEIGYHGAASEFTIDTKIPGGWQSGRTKEKIIEGVRASLEKLKTKKVS
jgi:aflatoxin B1 aldehyde reductase